jgi:hypothetical protein
VRHALSRFSFGGQDAGDGLFIDLFFGSLGEAAGEFLVTDGLRRDQKGQERVDLLGGQIVDDLVKPVQLALPKAEAVSITLATLKKGAAPLEPAPAVSISPSAGGLRKATASPSSVPQPGGRRAS